MMIWKKNIFTNKQQSTDPETVKKLMKEIDSDGNGEISYEEFREGNNNNNTNFYIF